MTRFSTILIAGFVLLLPAVAAADALSPIWDVKVCDGEKEDAPCELEDGSKGTCTKTTCDDEQIGYPDPNPLGGSVHDCMLCEPDYDEEEDEPEPQPEAPPPLDPSGSEPAAAQDPPAASPPPAAVPPAQTSQPRNRSGCSVQSPGLSVASVGFGLLLLLWITGRRRRD